MDRITLSSRFSQQGFNTFEVRAILTLSFLVILCFAQRELPQRFLIILGPSG